MFYLLVNKRLLHGSKVCGGQASFSAHAVLILRPFSCGPRSLRSQGQGAWSDWVISVPTDSEARSVKEGNSLPPPMKVPQDLVAEEGHYMTTRALFASRVIRQSIQ